MDRRASAAEAGIRTTAAPRPSSRCWTVPPSDCTRDVTAAIAPSSTRSTYDCCGLVLVGVPPSVPPPHSGRASSSATTAARAAGRVRCIDAARSMTYRACSGRRVPADRGTPSTSCRAWQMFLPEWPGEGPTELRLHVTIPLPSVLLPVQAKSSPVRPNVSTRSAPDLSDSDGRPVRFPVRRGWPGCDGRPAGGFAFTAPRTRARGVVHSRRSRGNVFPGVRHSTTNRSTLRQPGWPGSRVRRKHGFIPCRAVG